MKNKVLITILTLIIILIGLTGCSNSSPLDKARKRAIKIGEDYLNYEITNKEAIELLNDIIIPEDDNNDDLVIYICIRDLQENIENKNYNGIIEEITTLRQYSYFTKDKRD